VRRVIVPSSYGATLVGLRHRLASVNSNWPQK
jgi:hypothetical protein